MISPLSKPMPVVVRGVGTHSLSWLLQRLCIADNGTLQSAVVYGPLTSPDRVDFHTSQDGSGDITLVYFAPQAQEREPSMKNKRKNILVLVDLLITLRTVTPTGLNVGLESEIRENMAVLSNNVKDALAETIDNL